MKRKRHPKKDVKQIQVSCPRKIHKIILKNLRETAHSKFNKVRSQKAAEILKPLGDQTKEARP